ncbi:MAG: alcohol dehydrogenase [Desulfobacteraceae bacterium]|nr:MAG: alcohol dehydrogenase [Desulfobacteraceae bacterium]
MKAIVSHGSGDFRLEDRPLPAMDASDVLVEVHFCGVCGTDIHMYHGKWELNPGSTPGHEVSGIVREVGSKVDRISPGDRVAIDPGITCRLCEYCRSSRLHLCTNRFGMYHYKGGGFAEYTIVPDRQVFRIPDAMPLEWAALLEPAGCCLHCMDRAAIKPGESVAVLGGGAIGLILVQLALLSGAARVILSEPREDRRELAANLGATAAIDPIGTDPVAEVRRLAGDGVDVVIESAGRAATVSQCFDMVKRGGRVVLFGVNDPETTIEFRPYQIFRNEITILGSLMSNDSLPRTLELIASGRLRVAPLISHVLPLEGFHRAIQMHERQEGVKILVHPESSGSGR